MIRPLQPGEEAMVEAFLARHADSSMFLRANLRAAGLAAGARVHGGAYFGAFDDGALVGVAARYWNGMVMAQAPRGATALARSLGAADRRPVSGFVGLRDQVDALRAVLAPGRAAMTDASETLYGLDLAALTAPELGPRRAARPARAGDLPVLVPWRHDYRVESFNEAPGAALMTKVKTEYTWQLADTWVLFQDDEMVATAAFNARLPEIAQIGGVWTPPVHRGRGHAKAVVGAMLADAREGGLRRAVLFADDHNPAALGAYRALGFRPLAPFSLVMFAPR